MTKNPVVTYSVTSKKWFLEYDYYDAISCIMVPQEKSFDLASVPRFLWWLIAPFELSIAAPIVHDWLYGHAGIAVQGKKYSRREADLIFLFIMAKEQVPIWRRKTAYFYVRMFGWWKWNKCLRGNVK